MPPPPYSHKGFNKLSFKKKAFTLAEVLITLTIIGVVAAMTIPTLISKHNDQVTTTKLKKAQSVLANAVKMAQSQGDLTDINYAVQSIAPYLKHKYSYFHSCAPFSNVVQLDDGIIIGMHYAIGFHTGLDSDSIITVSTDKNTQNLEDIIRTGYVKNTKGWYDFILYENGTVVPNGAPNTPHELKKEHTCPSPSIVFSPHNSNYPGCTYWTIKTGKVNKKAGEWFE